MIKKVEKYLLILIILSITTIAKADTINNNELKSNDINQVIENVNREYIEKYDMNFNYYNGTYDVSKHIYDKYNILVCTIDGITEHGNQDKNGEYRYLGFNPYGESIENPNYYYDSLDGRNFDKFNWISNPCLNSMVVNKYHIERSHFDNFAPQFREIFLYGFNYYHGKDGVFGNHLGPNWQDLPWENYYHIPIAPTQNTRGVAWLFHREKDGSIWYTSAWLPPLSVLENEESAIVDITGSSGSAVIAHYKEGESIYDVQKSVPTNEPLYVNIIAEEYLLTLGVNKIEGVHEYTERVPDGTDSEGNTTYKTVTRYIPYHYYKIANLEVYGIDHAVTSNYALPNGSTTLYPDVKYYQIPDVQYNLSGGKIAVNSSVTVWNDALSINGKVILDSSRVSQYAPAPYPVKIPSIHPKALYKEDLLIPKVLPNKSSATSDTVVYYKYIKGTKSEQNLKTKSVPTNSVTVHTPVVCDGGITSDNAFDQSFTIDSSRASIILGRPTKVQLLTKGQHKNMPGYGYKDFVKYTSVKQVRFPFDVYMGTTTSENNKFLKANTWFDIPLEQDLMDVYVPVWVKEGNYTIEYRTIAINSGNNQASEKNANMDLNHYIAIDTSSVKVLGRLYGFKITDIEDYPLWENIFRVGNTLTPSNRFYSVGLKDKDGRTVGNNATYTLPILYGSHPTIYNEGAIPLGYSFKFECETIGNYYGEKDCIEIKPSFYYVSKDGKSKQSVDLWYSEYFDGKNNYFVKVGSDLDEKNVKYIHLGDPDRNVSGDVIKETSTVLGMTEKTFLALKAKLGWYDRIILAKPLRTFVGDSDNLPSGVIQAEAKRAVQHWYGEYYLPNQLYIAPKGTDVTTYAKKHNGLSGNESFWLKNGYLVVNFNIVTVQNGNFEHPILGYYGTPRCNMWKTEGFGSTKKDYYGITFNLKDGDTVFYDISRHASDDYDSKGTH